MSFDSLTDPAVMSTRSMVITPDKRRILPSMKLEPRSSSTRDTDSGYETGKNTPENHQGPFELGCKRLWGRIKLHRFDIPIQSFYLERFEELQEILSEPLAKRVLESCTTFSAISMKIMCLGRSEPEAKPWIVIQCDPKIARHVRKFFDEEGVRDQLRPLSHDSDLPNFGVVVHATPPVQLSAVSILQSNPRQHESHSLCGARIRSEMTLEPDGQVDHRFASIGGLVRIDVAGQRKFYATTVKHIVPTMVKQNTEVELANEGSDIGRKLSASLQSGSIEDELFELETRLYDTVTLGNSDYEGDGESAIQALNVSVETDNIAKDDAQWMELGNLHCAHGVAEANLDWAAIEITDPALLLPNAHECLPELKDKNKELKVYHPGGKLGHRQAVVLDGDGRTRMGEMSTASSFLLLPSGVKMTKTYVLKLDTKDALQKGDCGKWVVDVQSFEVFGHIVGVDAFGEAFVIPMHDILDQMRSCFGADYAGLARRSEIQRRSEPSLYDPHMTEIAPIVAINRRRLCRSPSNSSFHDSAYASATSSPKHDQILSSQQHEDDHIFKPNSSDQWTHIPRHYGQDSSNFHPSWSRLPRATMSLPQNRLRNDNDDYGFSETLTISDEIDERTDPPFQEAKSSRSTADYTMESSTHGKRLRDNYLNSPYVSLDMALRARTEGTLIGCENLVKEIGDRDIVFLVDDSTSMMVHWDTTIQTLKLLAHKLKVADPDGMDLRFTTSDKAVHSRSSLMMANTVKSHVPSGASSIEQRLSELLLESRSKLARHNDRRRKNDRMPGIIGSIFARKPRTAKPLSIYVLTDGKHEGYGRLNVLLTDTVKDLQTLDHAQRQLSIQFIRMGEDPVGKMRLEALQDLHTQYSLPFNIVDTTPITGNFVKMLVGAVLSN